MKVLAAVLALGLEYVCLFQAPDGVMYDLSVLGKVQAPDYYLAGSDLFEYRANVCEPTLQGCRGDRTGIATQWHKGGGCVSVLGRVNPVFGGSNPPEFSYLYEGNPSAGVSLQFRNGDFCYYSFIPYERNVRFDIKCDLANEGKLISVQEVEKCSYVFEFLSRAGCPAATGAIPPPPLQRPGLAFWLKVGLIVVLGGYAMVYCWAGEEVREKIAVWKLARKEGLRDCLEAGKNFTAYVLIRLRYWVWPQSRVTI